MEEWTMFHSQFALIVTVVIIIAAEMFDYLQGNWEPFAVEDVASYLLVCALAFVPWVGAVSTLWILYKFIETVTEPLDDQDGQ